MVKKEEIKELKHEPIPGYKTGFYIAFAVAVLYLGMIIFLSLR